MINGLPGNGPWLILADCPAVYHNTASSARGKNHGRERPRCICPRAVALHKAWRDKLNARTPAEKGERVRGMHLPRLKPEAPSGRAPDLSGGLCRTEKGRKINEAGFSEGLTKGAEAKRQLAKEQCERCPLLAECRAWVLRDERPAGSWDGVYGGLDPWNRTGKAVAFNARGKAELIDFVLA